MARPLARPYGEIKKPAMAERPAGMPEETLAEGRLNLGMIISLDPADIPNGALQQALNARVRFDRTSRRFGTSKIDPTKPDSNTVIGLFYFKQSDGDEFFFRATKDDVHSRQAGSWTAITGTLSGSVSDLFQFVSAFDRVFFVNNGVQPVQEINIAGNSHATLNVSEGAAPTQYRFLTGFFNRLVGANLQGSVPNPVQIGWSGDANLTEWDPLVDESAGSGPLVDSPGDFSDFITGIFGFTNIMLILREQSIWMATKQPIESNPFNFYAAFPGVGCDCPYSAVVTQNALMWLDTRTKTVWAYAPNGTPEPIGRNVERQILANVDEKDRVFGSYNAIQNEYTIGIPAVGPNITKLWTYNLRTNAWVQDEMEGVSRIGDMPFAAPGLIIDALPGKINFLVGQINDLSPTDSNAYTRLHGRTDGEITEENDEEVTDPAVSGSLDDDSGLITTELISKDFETQEIDTYFSRIVIKIKPYTSGSITLSYSKDNRAFVDAKTKIFLPTEIGVSCLLKFNKMLHCRRLTWKLTATDGLWDIEGFEVKVYPSGVYRK